MGGANRDEARAAVAAAIIECSEAAIVSKDLDGTIQFWSRGAERIFGYAAAEVVGRPITILIPPDRLEEEVEIISKIRRGERVDRFETVRLTKEGRPIDVAVTVSPVLDSAGRVIGASKVAEDVTERRRLEGARAHLAAIVDSSEDAIVSKDLSGVIQSWNAGAERIFGYTAAEVVGRSAMILIPPERHGEEHEILAKIAAGDRVEHYETVRRTKQGSLIEVALTVSPIRNGTGRIIGASKVARDITERRQAERDLAAQREWFRVTLSSVGDAVIAADIRSRVSFLNAAAEKLTGWLNEEAGGQPLESIFQILNEDSRQPMSNPAAEVLKTGRSMRLPMSTVLISRDGTERPIADSVAPIYDDERNIIGVVVVFRDVTSERSAERLLEERREWQERLLESERGARAEAERANRTKDEFVATVSHELRTPLNAILGWVQILQRQSPTQEILSRGMDVIERNARLQAQLVSDLLDMSRIMSGKLALELARVDLRSIATAAIETVLPEANAKRIEIQLRSESSIAPIAGDSIRLQQVIWNLLSNAVKFSPMGGRVEVTLGQERNQARIAVSDNGVGIAPEFMPALFHRFSQGDSAINRRFGGLGLGLAIVKQLVELHSGAIEATSGGFGCGSTFSVTLPMREIRVSSDSEAGVAPVHREPASPGKAGLSRLRILVVENDRDSADLLEHVLRDAGAEVTVVHSASEALDALHQVSPELLVSDIGMPDIDGYELIRRIRGLGPERGGAIPAVAVTAFARPEDRARSLLAGYQAHLTKPIEEIELLDTVRTLASASSATRSST